MPNVNKCGITDAALKELNSLYYGFGYKDNADRILENYIGFLKCPTLDYIPCYSDNCSNPTITFVCSIGVGNLVAVLDLNNNSVTFSVGNITNGNPPYTYSWVYGADLIPQSPLNTNVASFGVVTGKFVNLIVTTIGLTITDNNGCIIVKSCYLTPDGVQCNGFVACVTSSSLSVVNKNTSCSMPIGLIVVKKT